LDIAYGQCSLSTQRRDVNERDQERYRQRQVLRPSSFGEAGEECGLRCFGFHSPDKDTRKRNQQLTKKSRAVFLVIAAVISNAPAHEAHKSRITPLNAPMFLSHKATRTRQRQWKQTKSQLC
jgi:hypothetical protein